MPDHKNTVYRLYEHIADWYDRARTKDLMEREYLNLILADIPVARDILDLTGS